MENLERAGGKRVSFVLEARGRKEPRGVITSSDGPKAFRKVMGNRMLKKARIF